MVLSTFCSNPPPPPPPPPSTPATIPPRISSRLLFATALSEETSGRTTMRIFLPATCFHFLPFFPIFLFLLRTRYCVVRADEHFIQGNSHSQGVAIDSLNFLFAKATKLVARVSENLSVKLRKFRRGRIFESFLSLCTSSSENFRRFTQ